MGRSLPISVSGGGRNWADRLGGALGGMGNALMMYGGYSEEERLKKARAQTMQNIVGDQGNALRTTDELVAGQPTPGAYAPEAQQMVEQKGYDKQTLKFANDWLGSWRKDLQKEFGDTAKVKPSVTLGGKLPTREPDVPSTLAPRMKVSDTSPTANFLRYGQPMDGEELSAKLEQGLQTKLGDDLFRKLMAGAKAAAIAKDPEFSVQLFGKALDMASKHKDLAVERGLYNQVSRAAMEIWKSGVNESGKPLTYGEAFEEAAGQFGGGVPSETRYKPRAKPGSPTTRPPKPDVPTNRELQNDIRSISTEMSKLDPDWDEGQRGQYESLRSEKGQKEYTLALRGKSPEWLKKEASLLAQSTDPANEWKKDLLREEALRREYVPGAWK